MTTSFQPVTLATNYGDAEAVLVFCESRLLAVLSRLDGFHDELAGRWFVETFYGDPNGLSADTFASPEEFVAVRCG